MIGIKKTLLLALVLAVFISTPLFASVTGGILGLRSASTEHFDIIYEKGNKQTASVIYDSCEDLYESLVEYYGKDPDFHIPVVITSQYKVLNAYYTSYTANHIVLFDTVGTVGSLSNYPQTLQYIFRHELTHAFQFNLRGKVTQILADIFGDIVSISPIGYMYPSMSEGGAVLSESLDGYGRLNDSYAMQIVKQAKLEGLFPQWIDIAGARDTYPSGLLYYNFAAAFLEYLSLTYGYDVVADIYVNFGQPGWFNDVDDIFKDHLGITVEQAWQHFFAWVEVPSEVADSSEVSSLTRSGYYSNLVYTDLGYVYVYDSSSWSVLQITPDLSECNQLVLAPTNDPELDISDDSIKLLLVPEVLEGKTALKLINADGSKMGRTLHEFTDKDKDVRSGCFVTIDGIKCVLAYSNEGQTTYLDVYDMIDYKAIEGKSLCLGYGVIASEFCSIGDSKAAFLISYQSHDYIAILDLSDMSLEALDNPVDAQLTSLGVGRSGDNDILCFTWYPAGSDDSSLGRYGEFDVSSMTVRLSRTNVCGSMNSALRINDQILFVAKYYESINLRTIAVSDMDFFMEGVLGSSTMFETNAPDGSGLAETSRMYLPFKYVKDGVLVPFGMATYGYNSYDIGIGATWISQDPTETYGIEVSAGSGFSSLAFASIALNSTSLIPYTAYVAYNYYPEDIHGLETGIDISTSLTLGHAGESLSFGDSFDYSFFFKPDGSVETGMSNYFLADYSNYRRTGMGVYDKSGFTIQAYLSDLNPGVSFSFMYPHLLWWIDCDGDETYNLPVTLTLSTNYDVASNSFGFTGFVDLVLYSHEIQSGVPFLGMYFTREVVDLQYTGSFRTNDLNYYNIMKLSCLLYMSPVIGEYLTNTSFSLGFSLVTNLVDQTLFTLAYGIDI